MPVKGCRQGDDCPGRRDVDTAHQWRPLCFPSLVLLVEILA